MSNVATVEKFFRSYLKRDFNGMLACLDDRVHFSDYAFDDIQGAKVRAMWQWLCTRTPPIEMLGYKVLREEGDKVIARYRIRYLYRPDEKSEPRKVDYVIGSTFTLADGRIMEQKDWFYELTEFEFAKILVGLPRALLAHTPFLRLLVRKNMGDTLVDFMAEKPMTEASVRQT
jgi:ketosteroid isomerase-like protein